MEQYRVTKYANPASSVREWATNQTERQSLVVQVSCLITEYAFTNGAEQLGARRIAERLVKRYSENLGSNQYHDANLQARQLSQLSKHTIDPMTAEPRNSLPVQEAAK